MSDKLLIGMAEESITPKGSISLRGQFYERISEYVETEITVTAMAVQQGNEQFTILSCDLTSISDNVVEGIRAKLADLDGFDPEKLMVNATHTHTSHSYVMKKRYDSTSNVAIMNRYANGKKYVPLTGDKKPAVSGAESLEFIIERGAAAVRRAWNERHPVSMKFGFGRAAVGMCRRVGYDDGSAKMWGDTNLANFDALEAGNDSGIEIGFVFGENEKLEGVIANVSCPSQILEHRSFISSDYWGKVKIILREKFGEDLKVLCLCAPAGDQCPRDLVRWVNPETPINDPNIKRPNYIERTADPSMFDIRGTWVAGRRIAREIIDAYEESAVADPCNVLRHEVLHIDLPYRRVTIAECEQADKTLREFFAQAGETFTYEDNARMHIQAGTIARYEDQQKRDVFPVEVHVVRLGNVAFATNSFELFLDYGNQIRARSKARQTFLIQLCCGADGYLPTEKAEKGSHYSAYVTSGHVGHEGGSLLVRKTVQTLNAMFAEDAPSEKKEASPVD